MKELTPKQWSTILNALKVAALRYDDNAKAMDDIPHKPLAETFRHQAFEARELHDTLEEEVLNG